MERRRSLEIFLIVLSVILFLAFVTFLIISIVLLTERSSKHQGGDQGRDSSTCMTSSCIINSATMMQIINESVNPCENFYEFACGSWLKNTRIPDSKSTIGFLSSIGDKVAEDVRALIEIPAKKNDPIYEQNVKNFYASCMNDVKIDSLGTEPMLNLLKQYGGWPVINETWKESDYNLTDLLIKLKFVVGDPLIDISISLNETDSSRFALTVSVGSLTSEKENYLNEEQANVLERLNNYIFMVADGFGIIKNKTQLMNDAKNIVAFEKQLAVISETDDSLESKNFKTITEISDIIGSEFDFKNVVYSIFDMVNISLHGNENVTLAGSFIDQLPQLLKDTPKRTVMSYIMWRLIDAYIFTMPRKFLNLYLTNVNTIEIWKNCATKTIDNFEFSVINLYVKNYFNEQTKDPTTEMVRNIKQAFLTIIDELTWMSSEAKKAAKEKVEYIKELIAYPDEAMNVTILNMEFDNRIIMADDDILANVLYVERKSTTELLTYLKEMTSKSLWAIKATDANAVYLPNTNSIAVPAAILQNPFYSADNPKYLNFGALGTIIGHEITHGFDDTGSRYDKDGNLRSWWPKGDVEAFTEQTKCMVDQYSNYLIPEIDIYTNGQKTLGENIADNGGLKEAFLAYKNWVKQNGEEKALPGLKYNVHQLFFIRYGQNWCDKTDPAYAKALFNADEHSPERFRVIGSVSNSKEFSEAFNCPSGSAMNPVKKCSVW